jgi:hypothetical protein
VKRTDNFTELQKEFKLFEACGTKIESLEKITLDIMRVKRK